MAVDLISILPAYFRPITEFQQIMNVDETALKKLESQMRQIAENCFIQTCDGDTIAIYEDRFGIISDPGETLDFRRQRILQKYNTIVPFSIGFLKSRLTDLFGADYLLSSDPQKCTLTISVTSSRYEAVDLLYDLLWDIIPAHLEVVANQQVTNYVSGSLYTAGAVGVAYAQTI